jgi:hypothetical protein
MGALTAQDLAFLVEMRSELRQAAGSLFKLSDGRPESCGMNTDYEWTDNENAGNVSPGRARS